MLDLTTNVKYVKGVGPRIAEMLTTKGIQTVEDLLYYLPFRYEDRLNPRSIAELREGEMASIICEVRGSMLFRTRKMPIFEATFGQGRNTLKARWFHGTWLKDKLRPGQIVALYGKVEAGGRGKNNFEINHPQMEILTAGPEPILDNALPLKDSMERAAQQEREAQARLDQSLEVGRIVPIYESAADQKLSPRWFRRILYNTLENLSLAIPDGVPAAIRERLQLVDRRSAFQKVHFPDAGTSFANLESSRTPAHIRLIFEELFFLEVGLELKRRRMRARKGIKFELTENVRSAIKRFLPFHPTNAQKRVFGEIAADMQYPAPMRRMVQGDVGSGKTLVALEAAIVAIENGYQCALMAPTEILATQHYLNARRWMEKCGYRVDLLTGSLEAQKKRDIRRSVASGATRLIIGTHALIEDKVEFAKLGLVIVDEQHRFGVMQRYKLMKKNDGVEPDTLVMTATPIPRTLALTLYGDLDTSIIDELPPGRTPITTRRVTDEREEEVWQFVRKQVKAGRQAYVVYPVIEGAASSGDPQAELEFAAYEFAPELDEKNRKKLDLKSATVMYDKLRRKVFSDLRVGLLHGRIPAEEKEAIMRSFQAGTIDVLVSTTVIEVGVDVANATVMVVEHAERFGLSQLHQLRGRIGRGAAKSFCVLMTSAKANVTPQAERRLDEMVRTQDGFQIAELDLELRGPGEFFGTKQAGVPMFRVANLIRDRKLLEIAKVEAAALVAGTSANVSQSDVSTVMDHLKNHWQRRYGLVEVG